MEISQELEFSVLLDALRGCMRDFSRSAHLPGIVERGDTAECAPSKWCHSEGWLRPLVSRLCWACARCCSMVTVKMAHRSQYAGVSS